MRNVLVVNRESHWPLDVDNVEVVTPRRFLTDSSFSEGRMRVFNLCKSYRYQTTGYYVSLLAEARGHRAIPSVTTLQDMRSPTLLRSVADDVEDLIQTSLRKADPPRFVLRIYFGETLERSCRELGHKLHNLFQAPLLQAVFVKMDRWVLTQLSPLPIAKVPPEDRDRLPDLAHRYFGKKQFRHPVIQHNPYDMAILVDPTEASPPSDKQALGRIETAADKLGFDVEFITREDYSRLSEFDALFIRETTSVNHHTYRFSRRAYAEGLVVVDDPWSILRCTNKVYLAEMLAKRRIDCPRTTIVQSSSNLANLTRNWELGFPCVLKQPDGSFSRGVRKAETAAELRDLLHEFFKTSDLVIAQEYVESDFDWRIGVIDRRALYACKYFMAGGHWQIYDWQAEPDKAYGAWETLPIEIVPVEVVETALRAANEIGNGFYGVDLKQIGGRVLVIEVNDNPSLEANVEDQVLGQRLYERIIEFFLAQIAAARSGQSRHTGGNHGRPQQQHRGYGAP
jgi:glutathione synthase/RimK-type ligase-like ATP-grasp enzyme